VRNYQDKFTLLDKYLDAKETDDVNHRLKGDYRLSLRESVEENVRRLQARQDYSAVVKEWENLYPMTWVDAKGKQRNDLSVGTDLPSPMGRDHHVPSQLPEVAFTKQMSDIVFGHQTLQNARDSTRNTAEIALSIALDVAKPSVAYFCHNVADVTKVPQYDWFNYPGYP
jgi:hypothetical protein